MAVGASQLEKRPAAVESGLHLLPRGSAATMATGAGRAGTVPRAAGNASATGASPAGAVVHARRIGTAVHARAATGRHVPRGRTAARPGMARRIACGRTRSAWISIRRETRGSGRTAICTRCSTAANSAARSASSICAAGPRLGESRSATRCEESSGYNDEYSSCADHCTRSRRCCVSCNAPTRTRLRHCRVAGSTVAKRPPKLGIARTAVVDIWDRPPRGGEESRIILTTS